MHVLNVVVKSVVKSVNVIIYVILYVNTYQVTPVSLQEVLSVRTGTLMDEPIPCSNKVDIRVLGNITQLTYRMLFITVNAFKFGHSIK